MRSPDLGVLSTTICVLAALTMPAAAQTVITSPLGMQSREGNATFFASTDRRYQSIDNTLLGQVIRIKQFALRRDKGGASARGPSTVDLTLDMGTTDMAVVSSDPDRNFAPNTRTNVFKKQRINWPDWSTATTTPAPFDLKVPLNSSFSYSGKRAFVWDLILQNGTVTGNRFDRDYSRSVVGNAVTMGNGCTATGQTQPYALTMTLENNPGMGAVGMRLKAGAVRSPRNAPLALSIAVRHAAATVPGWCARLHADPLLLLPMGRSTASGQLHNVYLNFPFAAAAQGMTVVTQMVSPDAGQPSGLVLSNGARAIMPFGPAVKTHQAAYNFLILSSGVNGFVFHGGTIIAQLQG